MDPLSVRAEEQYVCTWTIALVTITLGIRYAPIGNIPAGEIFLPEKALPHGTAIYRNDKRRTLWLGHVIRITHEDSIEIMIDSNRYLLFQVKDATEGQIVLQMDRRITSVKN